MYMYLYIYIPVAYSDRGRFDWYLCTMLTHSMYLLCLSVS